MQDGVILEVDGVSKLYSRSPMESQHRMSEIVRAAFLGRRFSVRELQNREFWALKEVSFSLKRGEAMGVIGLNGAGKTTLLRLLLGQFPPDGGEIRIAGKPAGMIDLTAGFTPRMSGRENIYLRSATMGRTREQVDALFDEIADFTELGEALDAPVSTYSSGMRMRLAFATTIFVDPQLLVIDEVLAVGDFQFRQKCLERVRALRERSAFVFASHSMADVARFCTEALVLNRGHVDFIGPPEEAIRRYQGSLPKKVAAVEQIKPPPPKLGEQYHDTADIADVKAVWVNGDGAEKSSFEWGDDLTLRIEFTLRRPIERLNVGVPIWRGDDDFMWSALSSEQAAFTFHSDEGRRVVEAAFDSRCFTPGDYEAVLAIHDGPKFLYRQPLPAFSIEGGRAPRNWGRFILPHRWRQHC